MQYRVIFALVGVALGAACAIPSTERTENVDGYAFKTQAVEIEDGIGFLFHRYYYIITHPDGTTVETRPITRRVDARKRKDAAIANWIRRRKAPGPSPTIAGPPPTSADLPPPTDVEPVTPTEFTGGD
ncbi:hypothetical protein [Roseovarius sp. E0-M6]|uniref:hypothetical protein n=1 Tax=Roseovarius sp. E0-M6 TaxID=3127118 RepID=UPI00300F8791